MTLVCLLAQVLTLSIPVSAETKALPSIISPNITQFAVHSLPNVTFSLVPNWAGQILISGASNDKLFFWLFQLRVTTRLKALSVRAMLIEFDR